MNVKPEPKPFCTKLFVKHEMANSQSIPLTIILPKVTENKRNTVMYCFPCMYLNSKQSFLSLAEILSIISFNLCRRELPAPHARSEAF